MVVSRARHTYNTMKNQIAFPFGTWNFVKLKPKFFGWMESAQGLVLVFFQIGWKGDATFSNQSCNANHFTANNVIIFLTGQNYFHSQERLALTKVTTLEPNMENAQVSNEKKKTFHISAENSAISLCCSGIMRQFSFYGDARKNL